MGSSSIQVESKSVNNHSAYWICDHKKEVVLTLIALAAIGAFVVGFLAVLANTTSLLQGIGAISQIGVPGGAALASVGLLVLFAIASYGLYKKCCYSSPKATLKQKRIHDSSEDEGRPVKRRKEATSEAKASDRIERRKGEKEKSSLKDTSTKSSGEKEAGKTPIKEDRHENKPANSETKEVKDSSRQQTKFKEGDFYRRKVPLIDGSYETKVGQITLGSEVERFSLSLRNDRKFPKTCEETLQRLTRLYSRGGRLEIAEHLKQLYGEDPIPNVDFELHDGVPLEAFKTRCALLLQDEELLLQTLTIEEMNSFRETEIALLHFRLNRVNQEKRAVIQGMGIAEVTALHHLWNIPGDKIRDLKLQPHVLGFLSFKQVQTILAGTSGGSVLVAALLPLSSEHAVARATRYLQALPIEIINSRIAHFSGAHLRLLKPEQLNEETFPWEKVSKEQFKAMFSLENNDRKQTQRILHSLDIDVIRQLILSDRFTEWHLRLLLPAQFNSKEFPWDTVFKKMRMSEIFSDFSLLADKTRDLLKDLKMRVIKQLVPHFEYPQLRLISVAHRVSEGFPWEAVKDDSTKLMALLPTGYSFEKETKGILEELKIGAIKVIVKNLSTDQLKWLPFKHLIDIEFPWNDVMGSNEKMFALLPVGHATWNEKTQQVLQNLPDENLKLLYQNKKLEISHIALLKDSQRKLLGIK